MKFSNRDIGTIRMALIIAKEFHEASIDSYRTTHGSYDNTRKAYSSKIDPSYSKEAAQAKRQMIRFERLLAKIGKS